MIEFLFLDLDDTILDFEATERKSIARLFRDLGIEPTEELIRRYHVINLEHWKRLERGEITRAQISNRFDVLFGELGRKVSTEDCEKRYRQYLSEGTDYMPGAREAVERLSKKYRLFIASNGTASVQAGRMDRTGLGAFFEQVFVSEELGANKPSLLFFEKAFSRIRGFDPARAMMVGDSLTSDILGGINAGIRTCWVNARGRAPRPDIQPDFEIEGIQRLEALLEQL
ncbi:MAG: noncanonical pyrimidine nucleotidase, YjjG family [Ruminococcaceae bacterium]|nr:noncanonical pyrimidine nucleotidase, YjjG family [Oscillospiraceae bacterium]